MALNSNSPEKFNKKLYVGEIVSVKNPNTGVSKTSFKPSFSLWARYNTRTQNQSATVYGTDLQETIVVVIRHNDRVNNNAVVKFNGVVYRVALKSSDENNKIFAYDYLTLKKETKVH